MPKFSLLLPTHNRLDLLAFAIETVRRQNYDNWELIVYDNYSTEDLSSYLNQIGDQRIRYFRTESFVPVTENWNNAINEATGDYIIMLGDDDGLLKGSLATFAKIIEDYDRPDYIYTAGIQYGYPQVVPGRPKGFYQKPYCGLIQNQKEPFPISKQQAVDVVKESCEFYLPLVYNMQHSIVRIDLVEKMKVNGQFFHSPYPDYYATNCLFLNAEKIVVNPKPSIMVGISPKSFGYFYINNQEKQGNTILNNALNPDLEKKLKKTILPGSDMNTSWLAAMEYVVKHFGKKLGLKVNHQRYRWVQIFSAYQSHGMKGVETMRPFLSGREYSTMLAFNKYFQREMSLKMTAQDQHGWAMWANRIWSPYPEYDVCVESNDCLNILDAFDDFDIESNYLSDRQFNDNGHTKTNIFKELKAQTMSALSHKLKHWKFDFRIISPRDWQELSPPLQVQFFLHNFKGLRSRKKTPFAARIRPCDGDEVYPLELTRKKRSLRFFGQPKMDPPPGKYLFELFNPENGDLYHQSGFRFLEKAPEVAREESAAEYRKKWSQFFDKQVEELKTKQWTTPHEPDLFSLTTTVYDTPIQYLEKLKETILNQSYSQFEWLVLDNGCTDTEVRQWLADLEKVDPRFRVFRVEKNIHIIPGNRYLLKKAKNDFIVPIDSDDIIYQNALEIFAEYIQKRPNSSVFYSDEHKIDENDGPIEPILRRPTFSTLYSYATCPYAHLVAFKREEALKLKVYSEDYAQGSHDWDTALRFAEKGLQFTHVPYVLYGWRIHQQSSSGSETVKNYTLQSQKSSLQNSLIRRNMDKKFFLKEKRTGFYHLSRKNVEAPPVELMLFCRADEDHQRLLFNLNITRYDNLTYKIYVGDSIDLTKLEKKLNEFILTKTFKIFPMDQYGSSQSNSKGYSAFLDCSNTLTNPLWIWDAIGNFELDPNTKAVGGQIQDSQQNIIHAGFYFGHNPFISTPGKGAKANQVVGAHSSLRNNVDAIYLGFCVLDNHLQGENLFPKEVDHDSYCASLKWAADLARKSYRIAYAPEMVCMRQDDLFLTSEEQIETEKLFENQLIQFNNNYHQHLSQDPEKFNTFDLKI